MKDTSSTFKLMSDIIRATDFNCADIDEDKDGEVRGFSLKNPVGYHVDARSWATSDSQHTEIEITHCKKHVSKLVLTTSELETYIQNIVLFISKFSSEEMF